MSCNCAYDLIFQGRSDIAAACKAGFLNLDEQLNKECVAKDDGSGCTAVAALLKGNKVYCVGAITMRNYSRFFNISQHCM